MSVAIVDSFDDLVDKRFDLFGGKLLFVLSEVLLEVVLDVLKDQVQASVCVDDFPKSMGQSSSNAGANRPNGLTQRCSGASAASAKISLRWQSKGRRPLPFPA